MPLLFTVFRHQPFPISPSGKSQLFVQVPSVIEFAAEIAAWKISFSLPADAGEGEGARACVCVLAEAHHLLPNRSSSSISQLRWVPTAIQLHFGLHLPHLYSVSANNPPKHPHQRGDEIKFIYTSLISTCELSSTRGRFLFHFNLIQSNKIVP